jgi:hypothetical protein
MPSYESLEKGFGFLFMSLLFSKDIMHFLVLSSFLLG